jgi:class 3 adenylate cyclase
MTAVPVTRYAPVSDGGHLAYQVMGTGPIDLLVMSGELIPIDAMHEEPGYASCLERLASFGRVLYFDRRGIGLSDPLPQGAAATVEQWVEDTRTVLDAAGTKQVVVFAATDAGLAALLFTATNPDRVSRLVLCNAYARSLWSPDFPLGRVAETYDSVADSVTDPTPVIDDFDLLRVLAPSVSESVRFRDWWERAGHRGASPRVARTIWHAYGQTDVRPALPTIRIPTLVLHRVENGWTDVDHGRYIADHISTARFVPLPGSDDLWWVGDTVRLLDDVEEFVTGQPVVTPSNRLLATVLFTDIVGSTQQAADLGDSAWTRRLDEHDEIVERQLRRFNGHLVKMIGDGFLATFDGPARAIHCASAIRDALGECGVQVRAGIHTGEVELRRDDVSGIAVHLAQRVQSVARPGEVLVSRTVVDLVAGSGLSFADRGERELKGIPGTWRVFAAET